MNNNGKPFAVPNGHAIQPQPQTLDLARCIRDASISAGKIMLDMKNAGDLAAGLEVATYQVAMDFLLEPVRATILLSKQLELQQAIQRANGIIG